MSKKQISSGAEKAEKLTGSDSSKRQKSAPAKQSSAKKKTNTVKAKAAKPVAEKRAEKKQAKEQKRLEAAKIRAERKQKKLEKKLEAKQKKLDRIAQMKQAKAERREARKERKELLKHETKEARAERVRAEREAKIEARVAKRQAAAADRQAKREHRLKIRAEKRAAKNDRRHAPGFGGWLAAVISLGVVTLALGTMLTYGWLYMNNVQADVASTHTENLYELNSVLDELDVTLQKARVANTKNEQVKLLSDLAVESETAETILERFPMDLTLTQNMTDFVNKMGESAQSMLYSVANGKKLTDSQIASITYMYEQNKQIKNAVNEITDSVGRGDVLAMLRGNGIIFNAFENIQNSPAETPEEITDGPFAESNKKVNSKGLQGEEISAAKAEELAQKYFESYSVTGVNCTGEVLSDEISCYNVTVSTEDGDMLAQISKIGGLVVEFNSFKDCADKNFSVERCRAIAEDFLEDLGYTDLKAVWTSENGTTCNMNFAYTQNGVIVYGDMIKVKVCEERGIVTGMEAVNYVLNHGERDIPTAGISKAEAKEKLSAGLEVKTSRLALIPVDGGERLAWEFYGVYGGNDYFVYIDALNGQEIQMFTVINTAQGRALQ